MNDDKENLLDRAREYLDRGRATDAEKLCKEAIEEDNTSSEAWSLLAVILMQQGLSFESIDAWEQSLKLDDSNPITWSNYGAALSMLRRHDEAETAIKKSLDIDTNKKTQGSSWYNLGDIYRNTERFKLAEEAYRNAIACDDGQQMYWANLGATHSEQNKFDDAVYAYKQAITLNPDYTIGWQGYAMSLKKANHFEESVDAFREYLRLAPQNGVMWNEYGLALSNLDRKEEELEAYQKATQFAPLDAWAWNNLGSTLLARSEFVEAEVAFRKAIEIDSTQKNFWAGLHTVLMELGNCGEEAQHAKLKSIEVLVREDDGATKTIDVPEELMETLTESLAKMQQSLDQAYNLLSQGHVDEAEKMFRDIISKYPESPELQLPFADVLIARGKYNEALRIADAAIKARPKIGLSWNTRGQALAGLGKLKEAEKSMKRAIEVEPGNRWLKVLYEEWLKSQKSRPSRIFDVKGL